MENHIEKNKVFERKSYNILIPSVKYFKNRTKKWGYCIENKRIVVEHIYDFVTVFRNGLAKVYRGAKVGYIDLSGNEVIPCEYDWIKDFESNITKASLLGDQIIIEKTDKEIFFCRPTDLILKNDEKSNFFDKKIENKFTSEYDEYRKFSNGLSAVRKGEKWGFANKEGNIEIPFSYDKVNDFDEALCIVMKKFYDSPIHEDTIYLSESYDDSGSVSSDHLDGYFSYLEERDSEIESLRSEMIRKNTEKWGVIDKDDNIIVPFEYEEIYDFIDEKAIVSNGGSFGVINRLGELVIPCQYSYIHYEENDYYLVAQGTVDLGRNNWGYIDNAGVEILSCDYNYDIRLVVLEMFSYINRI